MVELLDEVDEGELLDAFGESVALVDGVGEMETALLDVAPEAELLEADVDPTILVEGVDELDELAADTVLLMATEDVDDAVLASEEEPDDADGLISFAPQTPLLMAAPRDDFR